jgi:replicative DNA helicase
VSRVGRPEVQSSAIFDASGLPPQNLEAEEALLGALITAANYGASGGERAQEALGAVRAIDFYRQSHAKIFAAVTTLAESGAPFDSISLGAELERRGELEAIGGRLRLAELSALVPACANAPHWARLVASTARRREEWEVGRALVVAASQRGGLAADADLRVRLVALLGGET